MDVRRRRRSAPRRSRARRATCAAGAARRRRPVVRRSRRECGQPRARARNHARAGIRRACFVRGGSAPARRPILRGDPSLVRRRRRARPRVRGVGSQGPHAARGRAVAARRRRQHRLDRRRFCVLSSRRDGAHVELAGRLASELARRAALQPADEQRRSGVAAPRNPGGHASRVDTTADRRRRAARAEFLGLDERRSRLPDRRLRLHGGVCAVGRGSHEARAFRSVLRPADRAIACAARRRRGRRHLSASGRGRWMGRHSRNAEQPR